jgi:hypothetical protein
VNSNFVPILALYGELWHLSPFADSGKGSTNNSETGKSF